MGDYIRLRRLSKGQGGRGNHGRRIPIGANETGNDERQREEQEDPTRR
jgi:hypothetical protein